MKIIKETNISVCHFGKCKFCNYTGKIKEVTYYHVVTGKDGKKYAVDGKNIK